MVFFFYTIIHNQRRQEAAVCFKGACPARDRREGCGRKGRKGTALPVSLAVARTRYPRWSSDRTSHDPMNPVDPLTHTVGLAGESRPSIIIIYPIHGSVPSHDDTLLTSKKRLLLRPRDLASARLSNQVNYREVNQYK